MSKERFHQHLTDRIVRRSRLVRDNGRSPGIAAAAGAIVAPDQRLRLAPVGHLPSVAREGCHHAQGPEGLLVAFYKEIKIESAEHGEDERTSRLFARATHCSMPIRWTACRRPQSLRLSRSYQMSMASSAVGGPGSFMAATGPASSPSSMKSICRLRSVHRLSRFESDMGSGPCGDTGAHHRLAPSTFIPVVPFPWGGANVFRSWHCLSLSGYRGRQAPQSRLDGCDILLDLGDRRAAVKVCRRLEVYRKLPAVHPQILKRLAVFQTGIAFNNQFNRTRLRRAGIRLALPHLLPELPQAIPNGHPRPAIN